MLDTAADALQAAYGADTTPTDSTSIATGKSVSGPDGWPTSQLSPSLLNDPVEALMYLAAADLPEQHLSDMAAQVSCVLGGGVGPEGSQSGTAPSEVDGRGQAPQAAAVRWLACAAVLH
jgi:hypothetical protein